jgi:hypothetical protein
MLCILTGCICCARPEFAKLVSSAFLFEIWGYADQLNNYLQAAESMGASALNAGKNTWSALESTGETWDATKAFLDASVFRGQQVYLSTQPLAPRGDFALELQYLRSLGVGPQSWMMVPLPLK